MAANAKLFKSGDQLWLSDAVDRNKIVHDGRKAHALARVLAHEIVHSIDPDIPHGPEGSVMSANLTSELLLGYRLSFHETTAARLLEGLLRPSPTTEEGLKRKR